MQFSSTLTFYFFPHAQKKKKKEHSEYTQNKPFTHLAWFLCLQLLLPKLHKMWLGGYLYTSDFMIIFHMNMCCRNKTPNKVNIYIHILLITCLSNWLVQSFPVFIIPLIFLFYITISSVLVKCILGLETYTFSLIFLDCHVLAIGTVD